MGNLSSESNFVTTLASDEKKVETYSTYKTYTQTLMKRPPN